MRPFLISFARNMRRRPHELSFAEAAEREIRLFIGMLAHTMRPVAPPIALSGHSSTSMHVHVNVCHAKARGTPLSALEILGVWLVWIRFDQVTSRFAAPWLHRCKWCAPLYATGSEFVHSERIWEQGSTSYASDEEPLPPAEELTTSVRIRQIFRQWGRSASTREGATEQSAEGDVPTFLRAAVALVKSRSFAQLEPGEQIDCLYGFGETSPTRILGRNVSLNLQPVCKYGTLEFRRFESSFDSTRITAWAHFCVAFVEAFSKTGASVVEAFCAKSIEDSLLSLQRSQERSTYDIRHKG